MDQLHTKEEKKEILGDFIQKMTDSGYKHSTRKEIIKSGLTRYYRLVLSEVAGERKLYRSAKEMQEGRGLKKFRTRLWYRSKRGGTRVSDEKNHPERGTNRKKQGRIKEGGEGTKGQEARREGNTMEAKRDKRPT